VQRIVTVWWDEERNVYEFTIQEKGTDKHITYCIPQRIRSWATNQKLGEEITKTRMPASIISRLV
jgi:hypothetical protein